MEKPYILHVFAPQKNVSPFDVNMAYDAGWNHVAPYTNVELDEVPGLVQDTIFSRSPKTAKRTGIFIGGRDMQLAMDMLESVKESIVSPFDVSAFADPSGAFTTAAGLVAAVQRQLAALQNASLKGQRVVILGGTGPVGATAAVLAAKAGAHVVIMGRQKDKADRVAALCNHEYGSDLTGIKGDANDNKREQLVGADVVLSAAAAGVRVLDAADIASAPTLKVVADVNAVPPSGIEGVSVNDDGTALAGSVSGAVAIGALTIGNIKYQTQHHLLGQLREPEKPVYLHFEHAYQWAVEHAASKT